MYIFEIVGDIAWIARNLQNIENSIFVSKPARHFNLDNSDFDMVDNNDKVLSIIENLDVENIESS